MQGNVSQAELNSALELNDDLRARISQYEQENWAANVSSKTMKATWKDFLRALELAVTNNTLDDSLLIELINYLSTLDTVGLLALIGNINQERQVRFLDLLNWVSEKGPSKVQKQNARQVKERILMIYRMKEYPKIYSYARILRATQIVKSST